MQLIFEKEKRYFLLCQDKDMNVTISSVSFEEESQARVHGIALIMAGKVMRLQVIEAVLIETLKVSVAREGEDNNTLLQ